MLADSGARSVQSGGLAMKRGGPWSCSGGGESSPSPRETWHGVHSASSWLSDLREGAHLL